MTRRRLDTVNIYSAIQIPGLDLAVDGNNIGKLLTVDKISLSDNVQDEMKYMASPRKGRGGGSTPSSGFGTEDLDESPFYTFSTTYPLQRGNPLDKIKYDKRLLVDGVRLIWSPARRISMFAWPDAFKIKKFVMDSRTNESETGRSADESSASLSTYKDGNGSMSQVSPNKQSRNSSSEDLLNELGTADNLSNANISVDRKSSNSESMAQSMDSQRSRSRYKSADDKEVASSRTLHGRSTVYPMKRSNAIARNKHLGNLVGLLENYDEASPRPHKMNEKSMGNVMKQIKQALEMDTLLSNPKFALYINDCEVVFGSPETSGLVFLRSKAVRVGIVDK